MTEMPQTPTVDSDTPRDQVRDKHRAVAAAREDL
jgi:hypothetical protein